ncbi:MULTISPECIES: hypothetical protein [Chromobacterium]|uniref:hypothetical protein n=1 Tax=Chromobacterium TaxID=535 RepID=UPI00188962A3|nr:MULTISPECIES: hypothetical protein [Chromobacterium]WON83276.1 hypothetical protein OK026_19405 [Chromobacterium haemolyticum]
MGTLEQFAALKHNSFDMQKKGIAMQSHEDFKQKLSQIRESSKQRYMIECWSKARWRALAWGVASGISVPMAFISFIASHAWWSVGFLIFSIVAFTLADSAIHAASDLSKRQDRIYFTDCLNIVENESEMEIVGLNFMPLIMNLNNEILELRNKLEDEKYSNTE